MSTSAIGPIAGYDEAKKSFSGDWIEWVGGKAPVPGAWLVEIRLSGGEVYTVPSYHVRWDAGKHSGAVVAYRPSDWARLATEADTIMLLGDDQRGTVVMTPLRPQARPDTGTP